MAEKKKSTSIVPSQGGVLQEAVNRLKLIFRLMGDRRVSAFLKLIPVGALIYLISPIDLAPGVAFPIIGALDDAGILWLGSYLFVELCPPNVVNEHIKALSENMSETDMQGDIVDGEATDVSDENQKPAS